MNSPWTQVYPHQQRYYSAFSNHNNDKSSLRFIHTYPNHPSESTGPHGSTLTRTARRNYSHMHTRNYPCYSSVSTSATHLSRINPPPEPNGHPADLESRRLPGLRLAHKAAGTAFVKCILRRQYLPAANIRAVDSIELTGDPRDPQVSVVRFASRETRSPQSGIEGSIADDVWPRVYKFLASFEVAAYTYARFNHGCGVSAVEEPALPLASNGYGVAGKSG